jgi:NitT/TauT family transport system substrate-binding protein
MKKFILGLSLLALLGCGGKKEEDYTVKLGYYNCDHMTASVIAKDAGIFDDMGLLVDISGNGKVPQAMAAGQMDVGYIGVNNVFRSQLKGAPLVIGANNHKGGSFYLVVANDVKNPEDLIGEKLAIGTHPERSTGWTQIAKSLDIPVDGKNYQGIDIGSSTDALTALRMGEIKGFTACDPWASMAEYQGIGKIMGTENKLLNGEWGVCCTYTLNKKFIEEHRDLAKKMILAHAKAIEYIYENPLKSAKIFADNYNVPLEVAISTIYKKTVGEGRTLTWKLDPQEIKNELEWAQESGFTPKEVKYENIVDESIYNEANVPDFDKFIAEKIEKNFPTNMNFDSWYAKAKELDK